MQQQQFKPFAAANLPTLPPPANFNTNFPDGFSQTNLTNRMPMNQMLSNPPSAQQQNIMPSSNLLAFNNTNSVMSPSWSSNKSQTDKTVSLSAQEINDFLS